MISLPLCACRILLSCEWLNLSLCSSLTFKVRSMGDHLQPSQISYVTMWSLFFQNQIIFISGSDLKTCIAKYSHHLGSSSSYVNAFNIKSCSFQSLWKWLVRISELGTPKRPWGGCWKVQPFQEPMHWGYQAYFLGLCFTESDPSDLPSNISLICILYIYIYIYVCKGFNDHDQGMIIPLIYGTVPLSLHLMVTQWLNVFFF